MVMVGQEADMNARTREFRELHRSGCFVMPNPWDLGGLRILTRLGFKALATTSAGFAWSLGNPDSSSGLDRTLEHLRLMAGASSLPVNADFENGYAPDPDAIYANYGLAVRTGIAGISIEDSTGDANEPLHDLDLAVRRVAAARKAIDDAGTGVLLTARTEGIFIGRLDFRTALQRLEAYAEAGAECLYAPGLTDLGQIKALVEAVAPLPVNVLLGNDFATVDALARAGVRRISVGGALARVAWTGFFEAAKELAESGTFAYARGALTYKETNELFKP
jgi:2-methylisocitrate lyase-like PEP mutase family enzyme